MKQIVIKLIEFYQHLPLKMHTYCRHIPSCSEYAKEAIEKYGILKGGIIAIKRISRCRPFGTSGYDPLK